MYINQDPTRMNAYQRAHLAGEFDVYAPIPGESPTDPPLPPLAIQWKLDYAKRLKMGLKPQCVFS